MTWPCMSLSRPLNHFRQNIGGSVQGCLLNHQVFSQSILYLVVRHRDASRTTKFLLNRCFTWWSGSPTHAPHESLRLPGIARLCIDCAHWHAYRLSHFRIIFWWFGENNHHNPPRMVDCLVVHRNLHIMCRESRQATTRFLTTMA